MKKFIGIFFAFAMILSAAFISSSFAANAQGNVVVKKTKSISSKTYRGGKYVYRKSANGTRYVYHKSKRGTVYASKKTYKGGKWTYRKTRRGTKSVVSRTKKVVN